MSKPNSHKSFVILTLTFVILSISLIIGQRLGFSFAGGNGYEPRLSAKADIIEGVVTTNRAGKVDTLTLDHSIQRGEIIQTSPQARTLLRFPGGTIGLDQQTDLRIDELKEDQLDIHVARGRIMIDFERPLNISTGLTNTTLVEGSLSLIHYDFLEKVSIIPFNNPVSIILDSDEPFITESPVDIEGKPLLISQLESFDPKQSSAKEFYEWFDQKK